MRKIIVTMWVTLDGFIAGPNQEMDWVGQFYDEAMGKYETDMVYACDTLLLGRVTYQSFAGSWPHVPASPTASEGEKEYARRVNAMHKVVLSKTLASADWNNSQVLSEITPEALTKLKEEPGQDIAIYGSASIVQQLTKLGLIDEYQLLVHPIVLGGGKALFGNISNKVNLELIQTRAHPSGVVILTYRPAEK